MRTAALVLGALLSIAAASGGAASEESEPWTYEAKSRDGLYSPSQWAHEYPACGGKQQSPINIIYKQTHDYKSPPIQFVGDCPSFKIEQFHDAFKAETINNGTCQLAVQGKYYSFAQTHFHAPSEHKINGKALDAEFHFVHKSADGKLAVVGLFVKKVKKPLKYDPFVAKFVAQLKNVDVDEPVSTQLGSFFSTVTGSMIKGHVFNYAGSLTSPPCSEIVDWWVIQTPLLISAADFVVMHKALLRIEAADKGKNARPSQRLNGRTITVY